MFELILNIFEIMLEICIFHLLCYGPTARSNFASVYFIGPFVLYIGMTEFIALPYRPDSSWDAYIDTFECLCECVCASYHTHTHFMRSFIQLGKLNVTVHYLVPPIVVRFFMIFHLLLYTKDMTYSFFTQSHACRIPSQWRGCSLHMESTVPRCCCAERFCIVLKVIQP